MHDDTLHQTWLARQAELAVATAALDRANQQQQLAWRSYLAAAGRCDVAWDKYQATWYREPARDAA